LLTCIESSERVYQVFVYERLKNKSKRIFDVIPKTKKKLGK